MWWLLSASSVATVCNNGNDFLACALLFMGFTAFLHSYNVTQFYYFQLSDTRATPALATLRKICIASRLCYCRCSFVVFFTPSACIWCNWCVSVWLFACFHWMYIYGSDRTWLHTKCHVSGWNAINVITSRAIFTDYPNRNEWICIAAHAQEHQHFYVKCSLLLFRNLLMTFSSIRLGHFQCTWL